MHTSQDTNVLWVVEVVLCSAMHLQHCVMVENFSTQQVCQRVKAVCRNLILHQSWINVYCFPVFYYCCGKGSI